MASKNFSTNEVDVTVLVSDLREFFETKNYKVFFKEGAAGGIILDANQSTTIRDWLGLSLRETIRINAGSTVTRVEIVNQKWFDKIIVLFIGIVLWLLTNSYYTSPFNKVPLPISIIIALLIILPAVGAYLQFKITQDVWNEVENHVALRHTSNS